ncbi:hypothetical protein D3C73_923250 [compost metagenome]
MAAWFLHGIKLHALGLIEFNQFAEVLLVADVARAGWVPEVHESDGAGAGEVVGQAQRITGEHRRMLAECPQVAPLKPVVGGPQHCGAHEGKQAGEQGGAIGRAHGFTP